MLVGNGEEDALEESLYSLLFSGYLATYIAKLLIFFLIIINLFEITAGKEVTDLVSAVVVFKKTVTQLVKKKEKPEWGPKDRDKLSQLKSHSSNAVGLTIILSILIGIVCAKLKATFVYKFMINA